jgi:hypothetical protein
MQRRPLDEIVGEWDWRQLIRMMASKVKLTRAPTALLARRPGPALYRTVIHALWYVPRALHHILAIISKGSAFSDFIPTPASIPPQDARYALNTPLGLAVNFHPLV